MTRQKPDPWVGPDYGQGGLGPDDPTRKPSEPSAYRRIASIAHLAWTSPSTVKDAFELIERIALEAESEPQ